VDKVRKHNGSGIAINTPMQKADMALLGLISASRLNPPKISPPALQHLKERLL
jgi:hypothetical protein